MNNFDFVNEKWALHGNNKYRGYTPLEFVHRRWLELKHYEIGDYEFCSEVSSFLVNYLYSYYYNDIIECKNLIVSEDDECKSLALQILCKDFIQVYNLWIHDNPLIKNQIINQLIFMSRKEWK